MSEMNFQLILSIETEQKAGQGEDSAACVVIPNKAALIAALDGCGGAGSRKYAIADNWTGARIASFSCAQTLVDWFYDNKIDRLGTQLYPSRIIADSLTKALSERMQELKKATAGESGRAVLSSMIKPFPTTLAASLISAEQNGIRCLMMWAGDSRGYVFSDSGLYQITRDDLKGEIDPFDNIEQDGVLSNVISANDFRLNVKDMVVNNRCIILVATDGCYGYLRSPMDFESMLLSSLMEASSLKSWEETLSARIGAVAADDYTLQALAIGFDTFDQLKSYYSTAYQQFQEKYGKHLKPDASQSELRTVWNSYKQRYMWGSN